MRLEFLVSFGEPDQSVIRIGWAVDKVEVSCLLTDWLSIRVKARLRCLAFIPSHCW